MFSSFFSVNVLSFHNRVFCNDSSPGSQHLRELVRNQSENGIERAGQDMNLTNTSAELQVPSRNEYSSNSVQSKAGLMANDIQ